MSKFYIFPQIYALFCRILSLNLFATYMFKTSVGSKAVWTMLKKPALLEWGGFPYLVAFHLNVSRHGQNGFLKGYKLPKLSCLFVRYQSQLYQKYLMNYLYGTIIIIIVMICYYCYDILCKLWYIIWIMIYYSNYDILLSYDISFKLRYIINCDISLYDDIFYFRFIRNLPLVPQELLLNEHKGEILLAIVHSSQLD